MPRPVRLESLTVNSAKVSLLERINDAIQEIVDSVADPARGETASLTINLKFADLGNGEVGVKPSITRNPAREHFDARVLYAAAGRPASMDDPAQLDFDDLALAAERRLAQAKRDRAQAKKDRLEGGEEEPNGAEPEDGAEPEPEPEEPSEPRPRAKRRPPGKNHQPTPTQPAHWS